MVPACPAPTPSAVAAAPEAEGGMAGPVRGSDAGVLCAAVEKAMMQGLAASEGKVLQSPPGGEYREVMLPPGVGALPQLGPAPDGTRCYMNLEATVPALRSLLKPQEFRLADIDRVNAYLSPAGTGTPLHFDVRPVLIVQLVGTKLWQVSRQPAVADPHRNCVVPDGATSVDYDGVALTIPEDFLVTMLRPGDWLVVPRAAWHATYTSQGSISATLAAPPGCARLDCASPPPFPSAGVGRRAAPRRKAASS